MIHMHGLPITPKSAAIVAIRDGGCFVSHAHPDQVDLAVEHAKRIGADNGAWSAYVGGTPIRDWTPYYGWIDQLRKIHTFEFAVIPDVIDGDEAANDALLAEWPWRGHLACVGAPVWHLHESLERLEFLTTEWPRICLGSSGQYATIGTYRWWNRMAEAMNVLCDGSGYPRCKIHGLRMLDEDIIRRFPLVSADSTNIAQNIGIDSKWKQAYAPKTKEGRAGLLRGRIEYTKSPHCWTQCKRSTQSNMGLTQEVA